MDVKNKKVLFISYDGMTDQLGQSQVIPYLKALTKQGYSFHILSVEKKKRLEERGELIRGILQDAGIRWTTLLFSTRPPILSKIYDQWKLNRKAAAICREEKISLLHCRSYVPAAAGKKIANRTGIPFLFDMRGFWVDERVDSGLWKLSNPLYKLLYRIYKKKEQGYFNAASHIISLTHKGKLELINHYQVPAEKVSVIPCCADMQHFDFQQISADLTASCKQKLGIPPSAKVLSYLGSLGGWYLSDEMLLFFRSLLKQYPDAVFLFITHDNPGVITATAARLGISADHIRIQPASREEVPAWLSVSDWNIFFIKDAYSKKASSPTKQGEVMAMGIPVICNDIGDTGQIVAETGSGILVPQLDEKTFDTIAGQLKNGLSVSSEQIRKKAIEIFDLQQGADTYEKVYQQLLK